MSKQNNEYNNVMPKKTEKKKKTEKPSDPKDYEIGFEPVKKKERSFKPKVGRLIIGVIVGYLVPCFALFIAIFALAFYQGVFSTWRWLDIVFVVLILIVAVLSMFYFYGWLHRCMTVLKYHHSKLMRVFGRIVGGIGYLLRPFVLIAYGPNKKWLYFFLVGLPSLLIGTVFLLNYFNVLPFDGMWYFDKVAISWHACSLYIAIAFLLNFFLALLTRRCHNCGCMMTEIEHSIEDISYKGYDKVEGVDICGDNVAIGKYYVCTHCGSVKKGIGFDVQTDTVVI